MRTTKLDSARQVSRRGSVITLVIGSVALLTSITVITAMTYRSEVSPTPYRGASIPDQLVVVTAVSQAGVTPEALAVAGLTASEAQAAINEAVSQAESRLAPLRTSMQNVETARDALRQAERDASASESQLPSLQQALDDAVDSRDQLIVQIRALALGSLDTGEMRRFNSYHSASKGVLPAVFMAKVWTADDVARLSAVSRRLSSAAARGETDADAQAEYDQALADPDVAAANANYDQRLAAIQAAWDAALAPEM